MRANQLIFSLPADHEVDEHEFFRSGLAWASAQFGGEANVLSADVHLDERNPRCHVMNGTDMYGGPPVLRARLGSFFQRFTRRGRGPRRHENEGRLCRRSSSWRAW